MADQNNPPPDPTSAAPSFDPRTWAPTPAGPPPTPPAKPASSSRSLLVLVGAAVVLAAAAGGTGMLLLRKPAETAAGEGAAEVKRGSLVLNRLADAAQSLVAAGLSPEDAGAALALLESRIGAAPGELRIAYAVRRAGSTSELVSLEARRADGGGAAVARAADGALTDRIIAADAKPVTRVVRGEIDSESFYSSAVAAGVVDTLVPDFIQAFAFDFDLQREVEPGDVFEAAFEQTVDGAGRPIGAPTLLFASLETKTKSRALYRFTPPGESKPGWFDGDGRSTARSLMRTPVDGARISSTFGVRSHPVLGYTRAHKGVDFATPIGTPVYASGDGVVDFAGPHGGHGNYLRIRHSPTLQTAYAHLSMFGAAEGTRVAQGQVIAMSGNTGLSSGPHLHYEVIVDGAETDPLGFQTESGRRLEGSALHAFVASRDRIDASRTAQNR